MCNKCFLTMKNAEVDTDENIKKFLKTVFSKAKDERFQI